MKLSQIDTNLIVALHFLLRERNVTRAGRRIGLSQSSMSHVLGRLRVLFADPLLVQSGRSLVPTELAQTLIEPVAAAMLHLERVFTPPKPCLPMLSTRQFRIAATDNLELYLLPKLAALLAQEAPRVVLRVEQLGPGWSDALERGDLDLKLGRKYQLPHGLCSQDLFEESFACLTARDHPAAHSGLTVSKYAELRHLVVTPTGADSAEITTAVDTELARLGLQRHIALTVQHFVVAPFVIASSDLILTAAQRLLSTFLRSLPLAAFPAPLPLPPYKLTQVWARRHEHDPLHCFLRNAVARAAAPTE